MLGVITSILKPLAAGKKSRTLGCHISWEVSKFQIRADSRFGRSRRFRSCHPDHLFSVNALTRLLDGELSDANREDFSRSLE